MEQTELTWKERFDRMKKHYGWTNQKVADLSGNKKSSVDVVTTTNQQGFPKWLQFAIIIFEIENNLLKQS